MALLTHLSFIYVFLPLSLLVYYLIPVGWRIGALLCFSLAYNLLADPRSLPLLIASVAMDYGVLQIMARQSNPVLRRACLWFSVVKNLVIIGYLGALVEVYGIRPTLGGMIYTLSAMECVTAAYREEAPAERNLLRFSLHCCFFPKLHAGPLQDYHSFLQRIQQLTWNSSGILEGLGKFCQGLLKTVFLAKYLDTLYTTILRYGPGEVSVLSSWLLVFTFALTLYYRLSGYCDMAVGIGGMFGFLLPQNFYYPYQSRSVGDFMQRFNSTVWAFIQKFVYHNLQEDKNGPVADSLNLLICGMLAGLWFGLSINKLLWGFYLAVFIIMERYVYKGILQRIPTLFSRGYSLVIVLAGFALLVGESIPYSLALIKNMLFLTPIELVNGQIMYLLTTSWPVLLLSCFFATNICSLVSGYFRKSTPWLHAVGTGTTSVAMLVVATALTLA